MSHDMDVEFMLAAYRYAEKHSTDPSTQNGAVLVQPKHGFTTYGDGPGTPPSKYTPGIVAYGANHFPKGVKELPERWVRPLKYSYICHAEFNAVIAAAKAGIKTAGLTMYAAWVACDNCAKAIVQAGIVEVIGHKPAPESMIHIETPNGSWDESIAIGMTILEEAGVKVRYLEGKLDPTNGISIRRGGKIYHP